MATNDSILLFKELISLELLTIGDVPITLKTLVIFVIIVYLTWKAASLIQRTVVLAMVRAGVDEPGTLAIISRLVRYIVLFIGASTALETVGLNLGALFTAGAVFAVGIGFAMQNIAQNFVSGVILLVERTIKPGDVLEVDGVVVKVEEMGIRSTLARTRDDEELIIPNATLAQGTVKNFTLRDRSYRLRAPVGVVYSSDLQQVHTVLKQAANAQTWRNTKLDAQVLLTDFGASSVDFEVAVWIDDPWRARMFKSLLNHALWDALAEAGITIAFPQLDVHLDAEVVDAVRGRAAGGKRPPTD